MRIIIALTMALFGSFIGTANSGIIFETDFSSDVGLVVTQAPVYQTENIPSGWSAAQVTAGTLEVIDDNGDAAAWFRYPDRQDPGGSQPTISLVKHLGDGFPELYVRYRVRLPDTFKFGPGNPTTQIPYWKIGRLLQNQPTEYSGWTENDLTSGYLVWNINGNDLYGVKFRFTMQDPYATVPGSVGGERVVIDWAQGSNLDWPNTTGHFEAVGAGAWELDWITNPGFLLNTPQTYHTIEVHAKLASSQGAEDGVIELWFDGVSQNPWTRILTNKATQAWTGVPLMQYGQGFNLLKVLDNLSVINEDWGPNPGGMIISDIVVADQYIGHDYTIGPIACQ